MEKYDNLSPYNYAGNNPVLNTDIHGDSIIVKGTNKDLQVSVTGKVINDSSTPFTPQQMQTYADRINQAVSTYFSESDTDGSSEASSDVTVADEKNPLTTGDHAIRLVDPGNIPDGFGGFLPANTVGSAVPGQNVIYVATNALAESPATSGPNEGTGKSATGGPTLERTVSHEVMHSGGITANGLDHPAPGSMPGNLLNPTGSSSPGTKVTTKQIIQMKNNFDSGRLNYGKQKLK